MCAKVQFLLATLTDTVKTAVILRQNDVHVDVTVTFCRSHYTLHNVNVNQTCHVNVDVAVAAMATSKSRLTMLASANESQRTGYRRKKTKS